jgi:hypothetical protein
MRTLASVLTFLSLLVYGGTSSAEAPRLGSVVKVETRGLFVPIYTVWRDDAVATVVLYSGGSGGYGKIGEDGWPNSANFLIRSAKFFAAHPFNVVLVGRASDVSDLDGATRIGDNHDLDNQAIFRTIKAKSTAPIWLVGTSMGTISVAAAAIHDAERNTIAGIVLTASVTAYRVKGAAATQALEKIKIPVLLLHHKRDDCKLSAPYEVKHIVAGLANAPIKKMVWVDEGTGPTGDACQAMHFHGFIGMEKEAADLISEWIKQPSN